MATLQDIAEGKEFDVVPAIRAIAKEIYLRRDGSGGPTMAQPQTNADSNPLATLFNSRMAGVLAKGGFSTVEEIRMASDEALLAVDGIDAKALKLIREKLG